MINKGDTVTVLEGNYTGKQGQVLIVVENVPKCIGIRFGLALVWFTPMEIEVVETSGDRRIAK